MSKIGFSLMSVEAGASRLVDINVGDWIKNVVDLRSVIFHISGLSVGEFCYVMRFTEQGRLICKVKLVDGRAGDHISSWIFVPNDVTMPGSEILRLFAETDYLVQSGNIDEDLYAPIFNSSYEASHQKCFFRNSAEGEIVVEYGVYRQLSDVFTCPFQPEFGSKYIILLDDASGMSIKPEFRSIIRSVSLKEYVIVSVPEEWKLPNIEVLDAETGTPFVEKQVEKGTKVDFVLRRTDGHFRDIIQSWTPGATCPPLNWERLVSFDDFSVENKGCHIEDCQILIGNSRLMSGFNVPVKEGELVDVKASYLLNPSFSEVIIKVDFSSKVVLRFEKKSQQKTPTSKGPNLNTSGKKPNPSIGASMPHERHGNKENNNGEDSNDSKAKVSFFKKNRKALIIALVALLVVSVISVGMWLLYRESPAPNTDNNTAQANDTTVVVTSTAGGTTGISNNETVSPDSIAVNYLENHNPWEKAQMDSIPALKGLFDLLCTADSANKKHIYTYSKFKTYENVNSPRLKKLLKLIKEKDGCKPNLALWKNTLLYYDKLIESINNAQKPNKRTNEGQKSSVPNQNDINAL